MFTHYRTQGIVLKKEDRREADQVFTIFTKDFGRLEIMAKSVRKIKSKLRGGMELFYLSEIEFVQGKGYKTLTDALLVDKFKPIRNNLEKFKIAYQIASIFDKLIRGQEKDENLWNLLNEVFDKLTTFDCYPEHFAVAQHGLREGDGTLRLTPQGDRFVVIYHYFLWNLLSGLGYQPQLYNCSLCQKKLVPEKLYFNSQEGGLVCSQCYEKSQQKENLKPIGLDTVKILRLILKKDWPILSRIKIEPMLQQDLKELSKHYLDFI